METKMENLGYEIMEVKNIISIAKEDEEVRQILLNEITQEFLLSYDDMVYEVIELAKHDCVKMVRLCEAILHTDEIATPLQQHFMELEK